jgi:pimeloyl-ACP methyl ester carboxylesterase
MGPRSRKIASKTFIALFAVAGVGYVSVCALVFAYQRSLIYYPQPSHADSPDTTLTLAVPDANIRVSVREHEGPDALIYLGGNAEDVSLRLPVFSTAFPQRAVYMLHYRGYGGSDGSPSEEAIQRDALALFDKVHALHRNIAVIGCSLGTGVAIRLASQRPASQLVLVMPYNSLEDLAALRFPYLPVSALMLDKFESWRYASRITAPTLILAAEHDEVIPRSSTEALLAQFAKGIATFALIPGAGHNNLSDRPEYVKLLTNGLRRVESRH